ncbi:MAG: hypothetical protein OI74_05220 [Gammaproteobacteria bacterium (ex Lamellibrachia satsuma)]|nr:MAG: DUF2802 domain-containing protein [Gammaproteobacteria bacterium (ex Lamellibrachia satsuma)]RRS34611.1 MAG: hypothetical protein OI74_05220 [Gammaproteobacteria bacterium (ex Lamellibrachia satsuma)]RRS37398.1 MAG: hypothetical protein NV67_01080 [Gammaproteobacteria bacterium (ex Lamellibrachia satsuma)]
MMDSAMLNLWITLAVLVIAVLVFIVLSNRQINRTQERLAEAMREVEILKQTVGALCSSSVGVDKRVNRIERHGRDLEERQESMEYQRTGEPPYAEAIRLVQEGAKADRLMDELNISRGEADLIVMLHGMKRNNSPID